MTERREASIRDVGGGQTLGPAWRNTIAFAAGHPSLPPSIPISVPPIRFSWTGESPRFDPLHLSSPLPPSLSRARNSPRKLTVWRAVALRCVDVTKWLGKWFHSVPRVIEWCWCGRWLPESAGSGSTCWSPSYIHPYIYTRWLYHAMYTDRSEAEWIAAGYRHTASRTSVRAPRSVHTHAHSATSGRVCVARAPHGNDESSTLEHLVCSFLSAFHRSRSLADCCAPSLSPAFALAPVTMCTRATQRPVGRGRVMISRLFTRSRRCLPPAFHWPSSLSSHWLCLPRGSRHSFERGGNERGRPSLSALTCGRVLANLRGRGDMFSFPMIYAGKWVARAWKCHAPRYRWQVSMGKGRVRASRKNAALYRPATRYHAIPRPVHTAPPHPLPTLWNHSTRHRVENHPVIPRPRSAAPTTLTVNFVNYPRDPVPSARVRPLFWRVPGIIDGLRLRALRLLRIFFQLELISID